MCILPIETNPWIQAYLIRNFELGLLQDKVPWIYNKYINICYDRSRFKHVVSEGMFLSDEKVFLLQHFKFDKKSILSLNIIDFLQWTCSLIEDGWYIYGLWDEYYIKSKRVYQKIHFQHGSLIYGYDKKKKIFYAIGYTSNLKYEPFTMGFDEYTQALTATFDKKKELWKKSQFDIIQFDTFKLNPEYIFEFSLNEIYLGIKDYISSSNTKNKKERDYLYGLNCERQFINYIISIADDDLDLRYSRVLMENKTIMHKRLSYLRDIMYLTDEVVDQYETILHDQETIHMLFLKYNLTKDNLILTRMKAIMERIISMESQLLFSVATILFHHIKEQEDMLYC